MFYINWRVCLTMDFKNFIGKHHSALENTCDFNFYIELYDRLKLGKDQDHKQIIDAFLQFVGDKNVAVLRMCNDRIDEEVDMPKEEVIENLYLLGEEKGLFFNEDWDISYAFTGDSFFAYILPNMLMFSSDKEKCKVMSNILDDFSLKYFGPKLRPDVGVNRETSKPQVDIDKSPSKYLQLKIYLKGIKPLILRRFVVRNDISFHELHNIIQIVMGWDDYHMYYFMINNVCIEGKVNQVFA